LFSCKKEAIKTAPVVSIDAVTGITANSATSRGEVTSEGGATVTSRGVCWSTSQSPTTSDSKTSNGSGLGSFTSSITGLNPGITYTLKAYAVNSIGTSYSSSTSFSTIALAPVLTTAVITAVSATSAGSGGNVSNDGGSAVTARGVCWSTTTSPTISNSKTSDGSGIGNFNSTIYGLAPSTVYYVRAYATNSAGTGYGNQISFKTLALTVTDVDGNTYSTVTIGTQVWMAENLKVTKYNDGTAISNVTNNTTWAYLTTGAYCWYNNDATTYKSTYGALYNWYTANTGKLCPSGWHVPAEEEWTVLGTYLGGTYSAGSPNTVGGKLKETGTNHWFSPNTGATNESGFTALPGGYRSNSGAYGNLGLSGDWWSSSMNQYGAIIDHGMYYNQSNLTYGNYGKTEGYSVRCLRDF